MNHLHRELDLTPEDVVEVTLDAPANVILLDPANFRSYSVGTGYRYYGGHTEQGTVRLPAPGAGKWHLVVNLGGYPGRVKAGFRVLQGQEVDG